MAELLRAADLSRPVARVLAYRVPSNGLLEAAIVELEGGHVAALATLRVVGRSERRTPVSLERPSLNALGDALAQPRHYSRFVGFSELLSSAAKTASARARPSRGRRIVDGSRDWWRYVDKGAVVSAVILLVVLSVGGVAFYVEHRRGSARDAVLKSLEGGIATYLRTLKARDAPDKHARYFRGQGVVLTRSQFEPKNSDDFIRHENAGEPRVASLHFKLPDELRAERPEAVSTVV